MSDELKNSPFVVTIRNPQNMPIPCDVRVIRKSLDWPHFTNGAPGEQNTWQIIVRENLFTEKPDWFAPYQERLLLVAQDPSPRKLLAMLDDLRRYAGHYQFTPETIGDTTTAIMAASLNVPVHLAFSEEWPAEILNELLDYFLRSLALQVPIEPFYFLATALGQQHQGNLWEYYQEVLGRNFFIDQRKRITLSSRWADREMFFGSLDQKGKDLNESRLWADLQGLDKQLFISQSPCAFCEHYKYCAGFWRTTGQAEATCGIWRGLMDRLANASKEHTVEQEERCDAEHTADDTL